MADTNNGLFNKLADEFIDAGEAQSGTMMEFPCLKVRGSYIACKDRSNGKLIVKLTESRVKELIESRQARAFAPAGKLFEKWACMEVFDEILWRGVLKEARKIAEESHFLESQKWAKDFRS